MKVNTSYASDTQTKTVYSYDEYEKQRKKQHKEFRNLRKGKRNYDMFKTHKDNKGCESYEVGMTNG